MKYTCEHGAHAPSSVMVPVAQGLTLLRRSMIVPCAEVVQGLLFAHPVTVQLHPAHNLLKLAQAYVVSCEEGIPEMPMRSFSHHVPSV